MRVTTSVSALAQELEHRAQLLAARRRGAAALLGADDFAAGRAQGSFLNAEVLIGGADSCVADDCHIPPRAVWF
jgi:hypothetical protein